MINDCRYSLLLIVIRYSLIVNRYSLFVIRYSLFVILRLMLPALCSQPYALAIPDFDTFLTTTL